MIGEHIELVLDTKGVYRLGKPLQYVKDAVGGDWNDEPGGYKTTGAILVDQAGRTEPYDYPGISERVEKAWEAAGKPSYEDVEEHYDAYDAMMDLGLSSRLATPRGIVLRKVGNLHRPGGGGQAQGQKEHPKHRAFHGVVSFLASAIESVTLS